MVASVVVRPILWVAEMAYFIFVCLEIQHIWRFWDFVDEACSGSVVVVHWFQQDDWRDALVREPDWNLALHEQVRVKIVNLCCLFFHSQISCLWNLIHHQTVSWAMFCTVGVDGLWTRGRQMASVLQPASGGDNFLQLQPEIRTDAVCSDSKCVS